MTTSTTDLAIRAATDAQEYMPVLSIEQAVTRYNSIIDFTRKVMKEGRDYGTIPGTGRKNDDGTPSSASHTLLKPGAEKLCTIFALAPRFEDYRVVEDWDKGLFYYAYRCIVSRNGRDMGECIGSANSFEKKYRTTARKCPACEKETIRRSKPNRDSCEQPGWYCWRKIGGCGEQFSADDPSITEQKETVDALAAADKINTLQKMAQKRAFVGAALIATNASEFFTQDLEDVDPASVQNEVIEGEVVAEATGDSDKKKDDAEFLAAWDRESKTHKLEQPLGRSVLGIMFKRRKFGGLQDAGYEARVELIGEFKKLTPEQIDGFRKAATKSKQAATGPTDHPVTPDQVKTWEDVESIAFDSAAIQGESDPAKVLPAIQKYRQALKSPDGTVAERISLIMAIRARLFDYATGEIRAADKQVAA